MHPGPWNAFSDASTLNSSDRSWRENTRMQMRRIDCVIFCSFTNKDCCDGNIYYSSNPTQPIKTSFSDESLEPRQLCVSQLCTRGLRIRPPHTLTHTPLTSSPRSDDRGRGLLEYTAATYLGQQQRHEEPAGWTCPLEMISCEVTAALVLSQETNLLSRWGKGNLS